MRPKDGWPRRTVALLACMLVAALAFLFIEVSNFVVHVDDSSSSPKSSGEIQKQAQKNRPDYETYLSESDADSDATVAFQTADTGQEFASSSLLANGETALIRWNADTGIPAFLTGPITPPPAENPTGRAIAFFDANKDLFRMTDPAAELVVAREVGDEMGMVHLHMAQSYKGVPVFGSEMSVHFTSENKIQTVNGRYIPGIDLSVEPDVSVEAAIESALGDFGSPAASSAFEPPQLVVFSPDEKQPLLVWKITLANDDPPARMVYFIDARDGGVVSRYDALESAKNRRTYTANNGTSTPGTLLISEGGSSGDSVAQAAHNNTGATYDYYYNTFGRDSFNGNGAQITTTVHYSSGYNNAFWNGQQMVFGDGDGNVFSPLGSSLDVVAHEMSHAVTQYTANLVYSYQSGALNESYSDVFGAMVDRDDWLLGETVYTPYTPGDALRSMSNPTLYGQPDHMDNYVNTSGDNGGVHTNSGIPNKAAYNIATSIGKDKMERIWYRTLTVYLNSGSQFTDARDASVQAAVDLYGSSSAEVTAVQNGFAAVGVGAGQTSTQTARIEIDHTYRGDLVVTLGVGNPASPDWSTVVSNRQGSSADNIYSTVDITAAAAYLSPSWQNRWFLKVYDADGQDTGSIEKFSITDNGTTFTATDTPVSISDYATVYSYVPTEDDTPPQVPVESPFIEKWNALNGAPGAATDIAQTITGGKYQDFTSGRLYWNQTTDSVYWIHGAILIKYDALGRENSALGLAVSDEYDVSGVSGARESDFTGGRIYWGSGVGAYGVTGTILTKYLAGGGPAIFGLPAADEISVSGGRAQNMLKAVITWDGTSNPAYAVVGGIMVKYQRLGGPTGPYGLAVGDETETAGVTGGRESDFSAGRIYWGINTGTYGLQGAILDKYLAGGGPASYGLPTTDAYPAWSGWAQNAQGAVITWDSSLGAQLVYGGIMVKYQMMGGPPGALHLIVADEYDVPGIVPGVTGAREADFQNGKVFWSNVTGAHTVNGGIYVRYSSYSDPGTSNYGPNSRLGLPITDEYSIPLRGGGRRIQFQHGFVTWGALYGTWVDVR